MTAREIIKKRMRHDGTEETPYNFTFEGELYRRLTEYYKDENWESKKLKKYSTAYLWADTTLMEEIDEVYSKDGYGAIWRMDRKPWHLEKPPLEEPDLSLYDFPPAEKFVNPILEQKAEAIKKYNADSEHYRIIEMGWGIFENTWRIRGFENALIDTVADEDFYSELTQKLTDQYLKMLKVLEDIPAEAYLFGDDWGDQRGVIIGAERWRKFIKPCWERIYKEVHRQGKIAIQHSCGSIAEIYDDLIEIGMDCHESVQPEANGMEPSVLKAKWGKKLSFWGCLGTQGILYSGTPQEIRNEILRLRDLFKEDGGYVLAPAKTLFDEMDIEKAVMVVETVSELNG